MAAVAETFVLLPRRDAHERTVDALRQANIELQNIAHKFEMPEHVTIGIHDSKVKFMGTCPACGKVVKSLKVPEMDAPGGTPWTRWKNQAMPCSVAVLEHRVDCGAQLGSSSVGGAHEEEEEENEEECDADDDGAESMVAGGEEGVNCSRVQGSLI